MMPLISFKSLLLPEESRPSEFSMSFIFEDTSSRALLPLDFSKYFLVLLLSNVC